MYGARPRGSGVVIGITLDSHFACDAFLAARWHLLHTQSPLIMFDVLVADVIVAADALGDG